MSLFVVGYKPTVLNSGWISRIRSFCTGFVRLAGVGRYQHAATA